MLRFLVAIVASIPIFGSSPMAASLPTLKPLKQRTRVAIKLAGENSILLRIKAGVQSEF
jgi:hypothetical protein